MVRLKALACAVLLLAVAAAIAGCNSGIEIPQSLYGTRDPWLSAPVVPVAATAPAPAFVQKSFTPVNIRHFVSSDPPNNALLSAPPAAITMKFSCDMGSGSFMSVVSNGMEMVTGPMITARDNRSLSAAFNQAAPTGNYQVRYTIYWCDGSYFDGSFGFSILRKD
jgi:methionine-rich copper-binding protein CopC